MYKKLLELFKDNNDALRLIKMYKKHKDSKINDLENDLDNYQNQLMLLKGHYIHQVQLTLNLQNTTKSKDTVVPVNIEVDTYAQQNKERTILKERILADISKEKSQETIEGLLNSLVELSARQIQVHLNEIDKINKNISSIEEAVKKYSDTINS